MDYSERIIVQPNGFTLIELLIVIAILSTLMAIAAIPSIQWLNKSKAESQVRTMHADLLQTRATAIDKNLVHFVVLAPSNYAIYEDTNNDQGTAPDAGDKMLQQTALRYPSTSTITLIFDQHGLMTAPTASSWPVNIFFTMTNASPEYDCLQLYQTRISLGKSTGGNCVP